MGRVEEMTLPEIHTRIVELDRTKQAAYRKRMQDIKSYNLFYEIDPIFTARINAIESELQKLWAEKRFRLKLLARQSNLSWLSPDIPLSRPSLAGSTMRGGKKAA